MLKILLDWAAMRKVIQKNRGLTTIDTDCIYMLFGYMFILQSVSMVWRPLFFPITFLIAAQSKRILSMRKNLLKPNVRLIQMTRIPYSFQLIQTS